MKHVKCMLLAGLLCGLFGMKLYAQQETNKIDSAELKLRQSYTKREVMIPMRDGVKLYTSIYEPKDRSEKHPILMMRTPYSCEPYGDKFGIKENIYTQHQYILVYQDIRGRHKSEGEFVQVRPLNKNKKSKRILMKPPIRMIRSNGYSRILIIMGTPELGVSVTMAFRQR